VPGAGAGDIEQAGGADSYSFPGTAGQVLYLDAQATASNQLYWRLLDPVGVPVTQNALTTDVGRLVLTRTGDYRIWRTRTTARRRAPGFKV
jgi:hypothetical protein